MTHGIKLMQPSAAMRRQSGLTLVELMVALVVGLVIAIAASIIYLTTSKSSRETQTVSELTETGQLALELIGREIRKAGFYPAQFSSSTQAQLPGRFTNTKDTANAIYNQGVFGCQGARFDPSTKACESTTSGAPDSLVINYMTTADFGDAAAIGNHRDCNRAQVSGDAANAAALAAGRPLFVSNRFALVATTYTQPNGVAVNTFSLACHGNGAEAATDYTPHLAGIEDMVISYGVYTTSNQQTPGRFYSASEVAGLGNLDELTPWQRVTAIRVCLVVRTPNPVRQGEGATARTFTDCRGNAVALTSGDLTLRRRYERVFAVRNHIKGAL
jgi:type IV pilus assembly protein PilW